MNIQSAEALNRVRSDREKSHLPKTRCVLGSRHTLFTLGLFGELLLAMSVEPITITLETDATSSSFPLALKKILEIPPPNLLEGDDGKLSSTASG